MELIVLAIVLVVIAGGLCVLYRTPSEYRFTSSAQAEQVAFSAQDIHVWRAANQFLRRQ